MRQVTSAWLIGRLLAWYDAHARQLPWRAPRGGPASAYGVLVSEFMLQQTTVATVKARFPEFLARFPDVHALAAAEEAEVLHAWQGLGYYRRARALHACARVIVQRHGGELPREEAMLRALPGIGPYTAKALRAIVYGASCVPVDGNVLRVMARLHRVETALPDAAGHLHDLAGHLAGDHRSGEVAQALMDLGATVCRPRRPACLVCPWRPACQAHRTGLAEQLPRRTPGRARPVRRGLAFLLARPDGAILFRRRASGGLLGGLHELPSSPWQEGPLELKRALAHAPSASAWRVHPTAARHGFTHFVLELNLAEARVVDDRPADETSGDIWCRPAELGCLALPAVMKKLLRLARIAAPDPERAHSEGDNPARG
jgi:A/G-specific adenine glycosylase